MDARLSYLKNELKIDAGQEAAWDAYAKQVKQQIDTMIAMRAQLATPVEGLPDRYSQHAAYARQRAVSMDEMGTALKDLYAALTPEQKTLADQYLAGPRMAQFGPRGYGRWR